MRSPFAFFSILFVLAVPALAQDAPPMEEPTEEQYAAMAAAFEQSLAYETGVIELGNGLAQVDTGEAFRYLGPEEARRVLEDGWGNPDGSGTLGMLVPTGVGLLEDEGWGIILSFEEDGYVEDEGAAEIDYDEMLLSMQESTEEENAHREAAGYPPVTLVGWATEPHYDSEEKKLYWAKELSFGDQEGGVLNYNIRMLGRRGVLVLNGVGSMEQLAEIEGATPAVLAAVNFNEGHRYADFDPEIDKVAAYGIGALIAGKAAAKVGLLKGLLALLVAGKKFVLIGVVALGALLSRMVSGPKQKAAG